MSQYQLKAHSGSMYAHLFENPVLRLKRNLYWSFRVDFVAIEYRNKPWVSSIVFEWVTLPEDSKSFPTEFHLDKGSAPRVEATFYLVASHMMRDWDFTFRCEQQELGHKLTLAYSARISIEDPDNTIIQLEVEDIIPLHLRGVVVCPDTLSPKPNSEDEARTMVSDFFDIADWVNVSRDTRKFVFAP